MNDQALMAQTLRALWGASDLPFRENQTSRWSPPPLERAGQTLHRYLGMQASGLLCGPNGIGKTWLLDHCLRELPDTQFIALRLSHSTLTGSDLIRRLCRLHGLAPAFRRSDNLHQLLEFWNGDGRTPVLAIDEAQNLTPSALEELRLLNCERARRDGRTATAPFALILCGDDELEPMLNLNVHRALRSRLGFRLRLEPYPPEMTRDYCAFQFKQVGVQPQPFDEQALCLLHTAAEGLPRAINQIALNALFTALDQQQHTITAAHVQEALARLPWIGRSTH